ncbi:hypothetical protein GCM10008014_10610 [Paenibacillus silvae]|uniref:Uncharacterized protein n=1 Tax=Paenibacillus silvae TaxID=1325358 RepID=A0ABQ1Z254_9BACL|nr:hypothetical protein [Paenibacillus silvae]GGH47353.1 hypothetical protein GCM10008014_10610 [Paenibacillus silvae]
MGGTGSAEPVKRSYKSGGTRESNRRCGICGEIEGAEHAGPIEGAGHEGTTGGAEHKEPIEGVEHTEQ